MRATGRRADNPVDQLPRVREAYPRPRPCPDKWIVAALRKADAREAIMLRLAAECGMRRSEIAAVRGEDVAEGFHGWAITIVGKGEKQRTIPINDELADMVRTHRGFLFPGKHDGHLHPNTVGKIVTSLLPPGWTTHTLRHRYATKIYEETDDIYVVSQLLGHTSVATTQRYVAMPARRLRKAADTATLDPEPTIGKENTAR